MSNDYSPDRFDQVKNGYVVIMVMVSFLLNLLPLGETLNILRPDFVALVILFMGLYNPQKIGFYWVFILGILMDTFQGSLLGQHGLAYALLVFSSNSMARRITLFGGRGQVVYILLLLVAAEVLVLIAVMVVGVQFPGWSFFIPAVTGALIWPIFKVCLTKFTASRKNS